ncbi:MAG: hypothetical protein CMJ59_02705 [Planctomycetaceae bacterium]|nr:hypothetical protein [Planctomycetaceae bacterium]
MTIPFTCPHCGQSMQVADNYAGQTGPCQACGQTITIPPRQVAAAEQGVPSAGLRPSGAGMGIGLIVMVVMGGLMVVLVVGAIAVALLLPAVSTAREAARRAQCMNQLKQISLAFHNYHDTYGTLPPAYIEDADGRPMHSWRVLILPFLEQQAIYDDYRFDEPWDSPHNSQVTAQPVPIYSCPSSNGSPGNTQTSYMLITGKETLFEGQQATSFGKITDGTANTILAVEVQGQGVHWASPIDLDVERVTSLLGSGSGGIDSPHPNGANVAMADGSVRHLRFDVSAAEIEAQVTPRGGEAVSPPDR